MEQTKLTVRVPRPVLDQAKRYAAEHNTTLTRLVTEYLLRLSTESEPLNNAPIVRRLSGLIPPEATVDQYHRYLEEKHAF